MNWFLICLLVLGAGSVYGEELPVLNRAGAPFLPVNFEITWSVPTNQPPKSLWVYKTVPQHFSDEAISNLMALCSFTMQDRKARPYWEEEPSTKEEWAAVANAVAFASKDGSRALGIYPALGYIYYQDNRAFDVRDKIEGVPSDAKVKKLALKILDQIGIPRSDLVKKSKGGEPLTFREIGTQSRTYHTKTKTTTGKNEIYSRGVFFIRQIDGVSFAGIGVAGGFYVEFVSHAKIRNMELVWRNLQRWEKYQVASPDQIIQWIREGKTVMPAPNVNPGEIKKLVITQVSPLYMGAFGGETQEFTYPFANVFGIADTGKTNLHVQLYCPILSTNRVEP